MKLTMRFNSSRIVCTPPPADSGRVEAISDPVMVHALGERFRPRCAVDVAVLKPDGQPDDLVPLFRAVPLPVQSAGLERGMYGFPEPGTVVELAFAYGLPDRPFIRTVLGEGVSLPPVEPGESVHQAAPVFTSAPTAPATGIAARMRTFTMIVCTTPWSATAAPLLPRNFLPK